MLQLRVLEDQLVVSPELCVNLAEEIRRQTDLLRKKLWPPFLFPLAKLDLDDCQAKVEELIERLGLQEWERA